MQTFITQRFAYEKENLQSSEVNHQLQMNVCVCIHTDIYNILKRLGFEIIGLSVESLPRSTDSSIITILIIVNNQIEMVYSEKTFLFMS